MVKCIENTEVALRTSTKQMKMPISTIHKWAQQFNPNNPTLTRRMQLRKRALASMGWTYHL